MRTRMLLASLLPLLLPTAGAALTATVTATPTPAEVCTPRPDPLRFSILIEPAQPRVGDEVRVTVGISEVDGLLFGNPSIALQGAALLFGRNPPPFHHDGLGTGGPVVFVLQAQVGGTAELTIAVNYETECACGTVCYYRRTVVSPPFAVTVLGPTATPTPACTPPLCGEGEVLACPDSCPGGCGTICATRTPTPCPTPPCRNDETFFCPDACPGGCGLTCATRTPTPIPVPGCSGDCNDDGRVDISELVRGVRVALGADDDQQCLVAFDRAATGTLGVDDLIAAVDSALTGCSAPPADPRALACRASGGVRSAESCCAGAGDFRDTCATGTCGDCALDERQRHQVTTCLCGVDRCFDGTRCVGSVPRPPTPTLDPLTPTRTPTVDDSALPCLQTGGTESARECCLGADPFPNTCRVDACACPLDVSHAVRVCECGAGRCYDPAQGGCVNGGGTTGACCLGDCTAGTRHCLPRMQDACCDYARYSEIALAIWWCPPEQFDVVTNQCTACVDPCLGLPPGGPIPTPSPPEAAATGTPGANETPYPLSSLEDPCGDESGAALLASVHPQYDATLMAQPEIPWPALVPFTLRLTYRAGAITCYPRQVPPPGSTRPIILERVGLAIAVEFQTENGAFAETVETELRGGSRGGEFCLSRHPDDIQGTYRPNLPGYDDVLVGLCGNFSGDWTNGVVFQTGVRPGHASEFIPIAYWQPTAGALR